MLTLSRTVRFAINDQPVAGAVANSFAGHPAMRGLGRHYELDVVCRGEADPVTGYSVDIKDVDRAVRTRVVDLITGVCAAPPTPEPGELLPAIHQELDEALGGRVARLRWRLTPTYSVELERDMENRVLLRQRFEFAASHRLHVDTLTDEENHRLFGKCNNPHGHGHNYQVEPVVSVPLDAEGRQRFALADLERITDETVVRHLDHKHLNIDVPEFKALNPSVEHIARVVYERLAPAVSSAGDGATLQSVTVWETEKTSCTYPG
ncbi:MAG: hypothetical protein EA376_05630 [Phycisphaeraceae bacterium]|nr:MAG: hypothetical protein EA376_05630 [Phycisphaeraceae bacterium]